MKVIDLLNKIANNEEVPKIFKFDGCTYILKCEDVGCYRYEDIKDEKIFEERFILEELNNEIEIIEEKPKKIEEMECSVESWFTPSQADIEIIKKVNELTKVVNYLLEKESE